MTQTQRVSKILNLLFHLKKLGYRESTLKAMGRKLRTMSRHVSLEVPEAVKAYVANLSCSEGHKGNLVNAYGHYAKFHGLQWVKPYYARIDRITKIPREEDINKIISHARSKYALAFSILRDTGMRPIELIWLRLKHVDLETGKVYPGSAKHGSGRVLQLKPSTLAMLKHYVHKHNIGQNTQIWSSRRRLTENWTRLRRSVATKLGEPQLTQIKLYDMRHFYATIEYVKTKDIVYVQRQLGHRNIQNTLRYIGVVDLDKEEFIVKVAVTVRESVELLEKGFGFVAVIEGKYLFKKLKLPSFFMICVLRSSR